MPRKSSALTREPVTPDPDFESVIRLRDLAELLHYDQRTIRNAVKSGRFPVPPLAGISNDMRWWGPHIAEWLARGRTGFMSVPPTTVQTETTTAHSPATPPRAIRATRKRRRQRRR